MKIMTIAKGECGLDGFILIVSLSETTSDKESVVSPAILVYTLRKKREIKTMSVLTRFPCLLVP